VIKSVDINPAKALHGAILNANEAIWQESSTNASFKGMGSTVAALLITPERAIFYHVGDSRIYQLRKGKILHRTSDHSLVFDLVRQGKMTEEQARLSDKSNIITRSLGIRATVDIETTDNFSYKTGDRFLLCMMVFGV
jgi:serine/threonine protein phosphatase PrpC